MMSFKVVMPGSVWAIWLIGLNIAPIAKAQERFSFNVYGNVHFMNMDGAPSTAGRNFNRPVVQLRELSLFLDAAITDEIMVSAELEASRSGTVFTSNFAYLQWGPKEWLAIKAGKLLVPFLRYNDEKINFKQNLMTPPFTASLLAPVVNPNTQIGSGFGWSDVGVTVEGLWAGPSGVVLVTGGVLGGLASDNSSTLDADAIEFSDGTPAGPIRPRNGLIQNEAGHRDNNSNKALVSRVIYRSLKVPVGFGLSYYTGKWDPENRRGITMWGINAEYRTQRVEVKGEWGLGLVEQEAGLIPEGVSPLAPNRTTDNYRMKALWVEGAWMPFVFSGGNWLKAVARFDIANPNDRAVFTPFHRSRITFGGEWQFFAHARLRYEWQRSNLLDYDRAPPPVADSMKKHPSMHMASVIFWF